LSPSHSNYALSVIDAAPRADAQLAKDVALIVHDHSLIPDTQSDPLSAFEGFHAIGLCVWVLRIGLDLGADQRGIFF